MKRITCLGLLALVFGCGGLDPLEKNGCQQASDCADGSACVSFTCEPGDPAQSDTDGDGLIDTDEAAGWEIVVDERGYGLAVDAEFLTRRQVTSDPRNPDSDGDGLGDREEFVDKSDPSRADTDGDSVPDGDEKRRWGSIVTSVDSDGDARDAAGTTLPVASLFDGAELEAGTSPTQADTDGDGKTDFEERDNPLRSPRIAEIPQAELTMVGRLAVQMNVTYSDSQGQETTYGDEYSTTQGSSFSRSDMESTAVTIAASSGGEGFFDDLEFSKEGAIKFFGGLALELGRQGVCQAADGGRVEFDSENPNIIEDAVNAVVGLVGDIWNTLGLDATGACDPATPETTNTTSTTITQESYRQATETYSEYRTESRTRTETASNGVVSVGFRIKNVGISTFDLVDPTVTMMQWQTSPSPDATLGAGAFRTLATLAVPGGRTLTLAPNQEAVVQMENREVNADFVKEFLARPQAIFFSPAQFTINDQDGVSFAFLTEETFGRTATLVIDDGVSQTVRFQIATNVDRTESGDFAGIRMGEVLRDVVEIPFTTQAVERTDADGNVQMVEELESLGNLANQRSADRGDPANGVAGDSEGLWVIYVKRPEQAEALRPFEDVRLFAGDEVRLVYVRDIDGDGLMAREEVLYGSDDDDDDSDDDGLSDFQELKVGWTVAIDYEDGGTAKTVSYRVSSNPIEADPDGDGWTDDEERAAGTDPNNADTDDDGLSDRCDSNAVDPNDALVKSSCEPVVTNVYVSNGALTTYGVDRTGTLTELASMPLGIDGQTREMVVTSSGALAYVATSNVIAWAIDRDPETGALSPNAFEQLDRQAGLTNHHTLVADPTGRFLYGSNYADQDGFFVYAIDHGAQFGRLSQVQSVRSLLARPDRMVIDPLGQYIYGLGDERAVAILEINRDPMHPSVPYGGLLSVTGPEPLSLPYNPNELAISPLGDALYVSGRNVTTLEYVMIAYRIDPADGTLTRIDQTSNPGAFFRALAVHPSGRFVYAVETNQICMYTVNEATGTLTWVDVDGDPNTDVNGVRTGFALSGVNDIQIEPNGRQLYAVTDGAVHVFDIMSDGTLVETGTPTTSGGDHIHVHAEIP